MYELIGASAKLLFEFTRFVVVIVGLGLILFKH